jgi:hypothetical protein
MGAGSDTACIDAPLLAHAPINDNLNVAIDTFLHTLPITNPLYTIFRPVLHQRDHILVQLPPMRGPTSNNVSADGIRLQTLLTQKPITHIAWQSFKRLKDDPHNTTHVFVLVPCLLSLESVLLLTLPHQDTLTCFRMSSFHRIFPWKLPYSLISFHTTLVGILNRYPGRGHVLISKHTENIVVCKLTLFSLSTLHTCSCSNLC